MNSHPAVIALLARKGGVGKSTLTVSLAVASAQAGLRTAIIDMDPQGSAAWWGELRTAAGGDLVPVDTVRETPEGLAGRIARLQQAGIARIYIDTPPRAGAMTRIVTAQAGLVLIPCGASAPDIHAVADTMNTAEAADRPAFVVMNGCPPVGVITGEAADYVEGRLRFPVADEIICSRVAFRKAFMAGQGVSEWEPGGKAAAEITALHAWVQRVLDARLTGDSRRGSAA